MKLIDEYISPELKQSITPKQAWHYSIVPKAVNNGMLELFIGEEKNINGIKKELEIVLGKKIILDAKAKVEVEEALKRHYPHQQGNKTSKPLQKLLSNKEQFILALVEEARSIASSDIHFEIREKNGFVRFRIDGHLQSRYEIPKDEYPALVNAIKIKANLDIAEKRLPQDGRIHIKDNKGNLDIRVSVIPVNHGEKIVFRLLSKDSKHIDLERIGFSAAQLKSYEQGFLRSHGMILVSGPTGSGKTTTLYATLQRLNQESKNILTIEDPVEYTMEGINQVQLKENIGLTFPLALKTFLRQDPDIIMVGEIRDPETAQIAIRASLTGHLVLSTIHTNSAWGIISRLIDMGVPEYLISATLNIAAAQRLVRLLCPECKEKLAEAHPLSASFLKTNDSPGFGPVGCEHCHYTGFKGRKAIFEVIKITQELKEMIKSEKFDNHSFTTHFKGASLKDQAMDLFSEGQTSFEEVLPVLLDI